MKTAETPFLTAFFDALHQNGVAYAVLRNADTLPYSLNGGDVDILVAKTDFSSTVQLFEQVSAVCGGKVMARMSTPHFVQTEMMGGTSGAWWGCCIDLFDGVYVKSTLPIVDETILQYREKSKNGIWTLNPLIGQYLGYVKELLVHGVYSVRYEVGAREALGKGLDSVVVSPSVRKLIADALRGRGGVHPRLFVTNWLLLFTMRHPFIVVRDYGGFIWSRVVRYVRPNGKMIVVLGTDGSGKSTLLDEVLPLIDKMTHKATVVHHLKPDLLPPLGRLRGVKHEAGYVCTTPHGSIPSGFAGSVVRIAYLSLDYILGYWLKVRVKLARTPVAYWIFDRYAYDMLVDSRRFRIRLPKWVIRLFLFFIPKPDLILCLGGDPEKIYVRKPETSLKEVTRQIVALKDFCENNKRAVWIDTTGDVEESKDAALSTIVQMMSKRYK